MEKCKNKKVQDKGLSPFVRSTCTIDRLSPIDRLYDRPSIPARFPDLMSNSDPLTGNQKQNYVDGRAIVNTKLVEVITHLVADIVNNRKISQRGIEKK